MSERSLLLAGVVFGAATMVLTTFPTDLRADPYRPTMRRVVVTPPLSASIATDPIPDEIRRVQARLVELGYWLPDVTGALDASTEHALTALEKTAGLARDGRLDEETIAALNEGIVPRPRAEQGIEVDLSRQVLFVVEDGRPRWIFDASSGSSQTPTVRGRFQVSRQIDGLRVSIWGELWRPKYFYRGQAIHGYPSVPAGPASHGCVRVTNEAVDHIWSADLAPVGTPVWIY